MTLDELAAIQTRREIERSNGRYVPGSMPTVQVSINGECEPYLVHAEDVDKIVAVALWHDGFVGIPLVLESVERV
jgi:hypothetical protein